MKDLKKYGIKDGSVHKFSLNDDDIKDIEKEKENGEKEND